MKVWMTSILVFCFSSVGFSFSKSVVIHRVTENETPWFLAQVYYGSGPEFPKILKANHLSGPGDMKRGMEIRIENPKFHRQQPSFAARYIQLWEKRQKALGLKLDSPIPHAKVIIPTEEIRSRDQTPGLPFTETHFSTTTPADFQKEKPHLDRRTANHDE